MSSSSSSRPPRNSKRVLQQYQTTLESNEDFIAAIVENLQIGRLSDCFTLYSMLQENLTDLAFAIDGYPATEPDIYNLLFELPEGLRRKDVLDDLRMDEDALGNTPKGGEGKTFEDYRILNGKCVSCNSKGFSVEKCRDELKHLEPSHKISEAEREGFLNVSKALFFEHDNIMNKGTDRGTDKNKDKLRVPYQRWTPQERFTLLIGIGLYGPNKDKEKNLAGILPGRTATTVRQMINRLSKEEVKNAQNMQFPPPPEFFVLSETLQRLLNNNKNFKGFGTGLNVDGNPLALGVAADSMHREGLFQSTSHTSHNHGHNNSHSPVRQWQASSGLSARGRNNQRGTGGAFADDGLNLGMWGNNHNNPNNPNNRYVFKLGDSYTHEIDTVILSRSGGIYVMYPILNVCYSPPSRTPSHPHPFIPHTSHRHGAEAEDWSSLVSKVAGSKTPNAHAQQQQQSNNDSYDYVDNSYQDQDSYPPQKESSHTARDGASYNAHATGGGTTSTSTSTSSPRSSSLSPRSEMSAPRMGGGMSLKIQGLEQFYYLQGFNSMVGYGMTPGYLAGT